MHGGRAGRNRDEQTRLGVRVEDGSDVSSQVSQDQDVIGRVVEVREFFDLDRHLGVAPFDGVSGCGGMLGRTGRVEENDGAERARLQYGHNRSGLLLPVDDRSTIGIVEAGEC